ncbi:MULTISPECIES: chorismate mutase [unclassified Aureimonas]|uniref:chorismate mutase n=1 Tax=unclassified Aureimonas TaxID=2615206 RepID=UPI0006FC2BEF|nr:MULTISPECIES: chorismate mutase [unclassified Aureimonas]KQT53974.1 chorismate mutase [Aureimonas sp. Leaf427]KQT71586.1 chorismate mutase [Aureimonas sp. Leaf460]
MTAATLGDPSRLAELRAKIDAIDESVHRLLMQRASVIDELIEVKGTARNGAAFRPGREADMMRRLAGRHEGHLPLTAVEHLWREIISTFTALQAPFEVAVSSGGGWTEAVEAARFTFGFSVPLSVLGTADAVVAWMEAGGDDRLGVVLLGETCGPWWRGLDRAQVVARLPFFQADGRQADVPALVIAPPLADPVPFEIACLSLEGPAAAIEAALAGLDADVMAESAANGTLARLVAVRDAGALLGRADMAGLDIRAVGGYAAPLRTGA